MRPNQPSIHQLCRVVSASSRGPGADGSTLPPITLTNGLIAANAIIYAAQVLSKDMITVLGAKVNNAILAGQWWRLISPAFLHGNLMHLVVNCYSLHNLAPMVESLSGGKRLLAVYMAAAVAGNVASFYGSAAPSLGASGAVFGVGGALLVYFYRNKEIYGKRSEYVLRSLWQTLGFNLLYGFANPRIDNFGHMGGLLGGAAAAWLLGPRLRIGTIAGTRGQYLLDDPPLRLLASPPRQIKR